MHHPKELIASLRGTFVHAVTWFISYFLGVTLFWAGSDRRYVNGIFLASVLSFLIDTAGRVPISAALPATFLWVVIGVFYGLVLPYKDPEGNFAVAAMTFPLFVFPIVIAAGVSFWVRRHGAVIEPEAEN